MRARLWDTDVEVLESLIRNEYYRPLIDFARKGLEALNEPRSEQ